MVITQYKPRDYNQLRLGVDRPKIMISVVVSELQFFKIEGKFHGIHAIIFHQPFFSIWPETFDTIDVDFSVSEPFTVVDTSVFETIWDKTVIISEPVRVDQIPSFDFLDS